MRKTARVIVRLLAVALILAVVAVFAGLWAMRGSLPRLDGELALPGLSAPGTVSRDALGVVTIDAANELSALFGDIALDRDRQVRVHRLRARLREHLAETTGDRLPALEAYRDGVNAGVLALDGTPWPYLLLRADPQPWTVEDTALAGYAMFFDLQDESNSRELALWRIREVLPAPLYELVATDGSEWDAPLFGEARGNPVLPGADEVDLRTLPMPAENGDYAVSEPAAPGSNNFAVAGSRTADGRAIVANDMHLGLGAPNIWFRARLRYPDARAPGGAVDISGFTLPGIPAVIVGSNGHVAWGFTNSYGDWLDFYRVEFTDADRLRYRVPGGEAALRTDSEWIEVKGGQPVELKVRETRWGPITVDLENGDALALRWTAQLPGALNFGLADMAFAANLDQGLAVADVAGIPAQNLLMADRHGRIAWRLTAQLPERAGDCAPKQPLRVEQACRWAGWLAPTENPSLVDPADGILWTANARVVDGEALALVGDAGYANGARARQIRDAVDYRIVRAWRLAVIERIQNGLLAPAQAALGEDFVMPDLPQAEAFAWPLVQQRPAHLLPRKFASWDALLADAARDIRGQLEEAGPLADRTWGERNTARVCHPLAGALPGLLQGLLCMPAEPLPGDGNMPLVQAPGFGASERMVVSPGREAEGFAHMPGGQSGHPMSPFWGAGHAAWVHGEATPFLPGEPAHALTLTPEM